MPKKLHLSKETLIHLSEDDLSAVSGGSETLNCAGMRPITEGLTQSPACPSGATWFTSCESNIGTCG